MLALKAKYSGMGKFVESHNLTSYLPMLFPVLNTTRNLLIRDGFSLTDL